MTKEIEVAISSLKGKQLWACQRAANMAMFQFGTRSKIVDSRGREKEVGELALHVQCAWHLARADRVLVGSRDLQYPADYRETETVPGDFDWDRDANRLDKLVRLLFKGGDESFIVENTQAGPAGSLRIVMKDGLLLELFPDDSLELEHWRLFAPGKDAPHLVVTGCGVEK